jgi:two-component system, chemotaxis family, CheB/CheR fusion protein
VRPALEPQQQGYALVMFDERPAMRDSPPTESQDLRAAADDAGREEARQLETALAESRQRLQGIVEEYETSQEELRASNEELQSSNEELRSTLEELETSKEELQSMNEELQTVNQENRHKVEELAQLSSDLQNLMESTDIATLFLDRDLRILRFTPKIGELFNIRSADRGRTLSDFTNRLGYDGLASDAQKVLDKLVPIVREVQDDQHRWYLSRVLPYRSTEDRIEGIVITFVDITERVEAEAAHRQGEERFRALVDASAQMVWSTDALGNAVDDSPSWRRFTGRTFEQWQGTGWLDMIHPDDRELALQHWRQAVEAQSSLTHEERVFHAATGRYRWTSVRAVPLIDANRGVRGWVGMHIDVDEQKSGEQALRESEKRYRSIVSQNLAGILQTSISGRILWTNEQFGQRLGYPIEEMLRLELADLVHADDRELCKTAFQQMIERRTPCELDM